MTQDSPLTAAIRRSVDRVIEELLASLPPTETLSADERRGIIARYASVLEGNFIYWMTAAWIAVGSDVACSTIRENLREEVRDSHPWMMRKFASAASALPTDVDALAVQQNLTAVRLFVGRLSAERILLMMAFFEGFIQRFMPYLAELARLQGSIEMEYTDVHGVCDVVHSEALYDALEAEMTTRDLLSPDQLFEGVDLLRTLIANIVTGTNIADRAGRPRATAVRAN